MLAIGTLLVLALVVVVVGSLLASHFYLTRAIFWGESDHQDLEKFPARTIHNAPPVCFRRIEYSIPTLTMVPKDRRR